MTPLALRHQLAYRLRRVGRPGVAGLCLLAVAFVYAAVVLPAASARSARLAAQIAASEESLRRAPPTPEGAAPTTDEQLRAFYAGFPKGVTVPDWLEKIYALADEQQLALEAGEYGLTRAGSGRLDQFKITFPLKAAYPQLRQFIAGALRTAPALALEGLTLKREQVGDGEVEARLVFLLYLEKAP